MPGKDIEQLTEILALILDQLKTTRAIESLGARQTKAWPTLSEIEGVYVGHVLRHTKGNKQAASRILNVDRKTLDRMIKRHELQSG
jgi:DNA-binding NtrC family response regulator